MNRPSHGITFDTLPKEIWIEIISLSITEYEFEFAYLSVDRLLPLTLVSNKWMDEIHYTPSLWTDIVLDEDIEDLDMKVACSVHFSQAACLSIYIRSCVQSDEHFSFIIRVHSSRICSIQSRALYRKDGTRAEDKVFGQTELFPSLTSIIGRNLWTRMKDYFDLSKVIHKAPLLKVAQGYRLPLDILEDTQQKWQIVDIIDSPEVAIPFLVRMPSLKEVRFLGDPFLTDASSPVLRESEVSFAPLNLTTLHLPLNRLSFTSIPYTLFEFHLHGVFSTICSVIPLLSQMPRLRNLNIEIAAGKPNNSALLFKPCSASVVFIFAGELYEKERDSYDALWRIFPAVVPEVRELTIFFLYYPKNFNISTNYYLHRLEVLHLDCLDYGLQAKNDTSLEDPLYVPPSVIKMRTSANGGFMRRLVPTSIEALEIQPSSMIYSLLDIPLLSQWTTLRSLSLSNFRGSFPDISLPNLVALDLSDIQGAYSKSVTEFCQLLAVSPQSYPSLKHLKMDICPEWDILVIMLERRNFTQGQRVACIAQIKLPAICPLPIRSLLIDSIQGRRVTRLSNFSLSFAGNLNGFLDKSISGCVECHQALRYCSEPPSTTLGWPEELRSLTYPEDVDEILHTWKARADMWLKIKEGIGRVDTCRKYRGQTICIDEYSHEEATLEWVECR